MLNDNTTSCGIVMGFYGPIWSTDALIEYATFCKQNGYTSFIYGPKMDTYLRNQWQSNWPSSKFEELQKVRAAFKEAGVLFGMAFSPSDVINLNSTIKADLKTRFDQINALDLDILSIGFDDFNPSDFKKVKDTIAQTQVDTAIYIQSISNATSFYVVPTYYSNSPTIVQFLGPIPKSYFETIGTLNASFGIFWAGSDIIPNGFSPSSIQKMNTIFNRKVTIWDNYPCNDPSWMTKTAANVYPFTGRPHQLADSINGHFANPMIQPELSKMALITLPKVYSLGSEYIPQDEFEKAALQLCEHQELATFVIENMMNFREVSYRPDYGIDVQFMQKTIQQLNGATKIKTELEDWFQFVVIKGIPNIILPKDQYLPQGSYLKNSGSIEITIQANCIDLAGASLASTLVYTEDQTGNLTDIANTNGLLTLESKGPLEENPNVSLGKYVPAGSYQLTSRTITITICAQCLNDSQIAIPSSLTYTSEEAQIFTDIKNMNGVLTRNIH